MPMTLSARKPAPLAAAMSRAGRGKSQISMSKGQKNRVMGTFAFSGVGGALVAPRCEASSQPTMWPNCVTTAFLCDLLF